jgi:hypothetical protein
MTTCYGNRLHLEGKNSKIKKIPNSKWDGIVNEECGMMNDE